MGFVVQCDFVAFLGFWRPGYLSHLSCNTYIASRSFFPINMRIHISHMTILLHKKAVWALHLCFLWAQLFGFGKVKAPVGIIFSSAILLHPTLSTKEIMNYHGCETGRLGQLVPLHAWHSMSLSRKKSSLSWWEHEETFDFLFPEKEVHSSALLAC